MVAPVRKTPLIGLLAASVLLTSCSSSTLIQSVPPGAKVYVDGQPVGVAPYNYSDSKIVGSRTTVRMEMDGYEPLITSFERNEEADVGAIIGGLFVLVPFLWLMKYKPLHTYELKPLGAGQPAAPTVTTPAVTPAPPAPSATSTSKVDRLRELKQMLDEKLITQEEYDAQKKKILEE
jgi:hypothetical protein